MASDLRQAGDELAEIAREAPRLIEAGVDAELVQRVVNLRDPRAAREPLQQIIAVVTSRLGPDDGSLAPLLELFGFCTSQRDAVIARWSRALEIRSATAGEHDPRTVSIRFVLAFFYSRAGDKEEALSLLLPLLAAYESGQLRSDDRLQQALSLLGICARQSGQSDIAERAFRANVTDTRARGLTGSELITVLCNLGGFLVFQGKTDEARPLLDEALALAKVTQDTEAGSLANLASAYYEIGDIEAAEAAFEIGRARGLLRERLFPAPGELAPLIFALPERWKLRQRAMFSHPAKPQYNLLLSVRTVNVGEEPLVDVGSRLLSSNPTAADAKVESLPGGRVLLCYRSSVVDPFDPRPKDDRHWILLERRSDATRTALVTLSVLKDDAELEETEALVGELTASLRDAQFRAQPTRLPQGVPEA